MNLTSKSFSNESDLINHLKTHTPSFYHSSRTSTVIPYDKLEAEMKGPLVVADLSKIPPKMTLKGENVIIRGAVNWQDADQFLKSHGRAIMTSPTEQLALILAGLATSCTGERCFAFGNMRKQIVRLKYLDFNGVEHELSADKDFPSTEGLAAYQKEFSHYSGYKNAPYPRFEKETDLLIGTEGQLGIITEAEIKTTTHDDVTHLFMLLPKWENDYTAHLEIFKAVQHFRGAVISCELLDSNSIAYLKADERLGQSQDVIFLEILSNEFERVYGELLGELQHVSPDDVFELSSAKFHSVRAGVPRAVFEENSKMGVKKMGTDCQVSGDHFKDLLDFYRELSKLGVRYNLFGHFGDAHLHYNYMPRPEDSQKCQAEFEKLYAQVLKWQGSPFAEHGIGLLKQKFIKPFIHDTQRMVFKALKKQHDPKSQFFPQGFMTTV
ncbi:MAG: FAD-binding oxidoreductase [Bacteriovoracaceae bacterium]|nr:FAD-binding oxidoreductase [Bacteriovoracaceae bacterium]